MRLFLYPFDTEINFNESYINILEVHDTNLFYRAVTSIVTHCDNDFGVETFNMFDDGGEKLRLSKHCYFVENIFNIDVNDKKIISKLYDKIIKDMTLEDELNYKISSEYSSFLSNFVNVFNNYDFDLKYNIDFSLKNFFKMIQLSFEYEKEDILKNLYTFIDIVAEFQLYDILIFSNIKVYFTDEKLLEFYKYCCYKKVNILINVEKETLK